MPSPNSYKTYDKVPNVPIRVDTPDGSLLQSHKEERMRRIMWFAHRHGLSVFKFPDLWVLLVKALEDNHPGFQFDRGLDYNRSQRSGRKSVWTDEDLYMLMTSVANYVEGKGMNSKPACRLVAEEEYFQKHEKRLMGNYDQNKSQKKKLLSDSLYEQWRPIWHLLQATQGKRKLTKPLTANQIRVRDEIIPFIKKSAPIYQKELERRRKLEKISVE